MKLRCDEQINKIEAKFGQAGRASGKRRIAVEYWRGYMDWPLDENWKCDICDGYFGLTWGLVHGECRCNRCHAIYQMCANDKERTVLIKPICLVRPIFIQPAKLFYEHTGKPIDEATKEDWLNFGVPEDALGNKEA